jgi:CheY-like chemotaxis protein
MSTVLVVDDDLGFLNALEQMLVAEGYRVLRAATGKEAVDVLEKKHHEIGLIVVDLALPDTNGFELIGAVSRRATPIKVIATSSVFKDAYLEMAGTLGAHASIRKSPEGKPFPESRWLSTVRQLIGSATNESAVGVGPGA